MSLDERLRIGVPPSTRRRAPHSLALMVLGASLTVGTAARRGGRPVGRLVQSVEEVAVPTLIRLVTALPRGLDRVERVTVPALLRLARAVPAALAHVEHALVVPVLVLAGTGAVRLVQYSESRLVPLLSGAAAGTAFAVARGGDLLAGAVRASGQGLLEGAQRVEATVAPPLSPRVAPPPPPSGGYEPEADHVRPAATRRQRRRARLRSAAINLGGLIATTAIVALAVSFVAGLTLPNAARRATGAVDGEIILPPDPTLQSLAERSYLYAADGRELQVLDREANRRVVELGAIPLVVQRAVIAAEDQRFYTHDGYDVGGIGRALVANVEAGNVRQGGSTITQQLAKSQVGDDVTLDRKTKELAYAVALEQRFTKDELLGQYLNQVYFGENAYGVAAAAEEYFGITDVRQLQVEHGALLAAMIRSPETGNPRNDPDIALRRRNAILDSMVPIGYLTQEAADAAKAVPLTVVPPTPRTRPYDFVADAIVREFLTAPELAQFGATYEEREYTLYHSGLRIHSTMDPRLQDLAQGALARNGLSSADPNVNSGALVTVQPQTGRVLAAASGLEYGANQQAIALQGRRQLGSAAKPFVYAEALRQGYPPGIKLNGASPLFFDEPGWTVEDGGVQNYGGATYGMMDMREAIRRSVNTTAVQMTLLVGVENMVGLMGQMGVDTQAATGGQNNKSLVLGGFLNGVTPLEAASSYGVFANGGAYVKPHLIERVEDRDGAVLYTAQYPGQQVLSPEVNATMVSMMQDVVTAGTATRAAIPGWQVAGKTGTTTEQKDAWFVGYTPTLSTAMWLGVPARATTTGDNGGGLPATVWQQYMAAALAGQPPVPFPSVPMGPGGPTPGQPVTVPAVTGGPADAALTALTAARLVGEVRTVPNPAPAGTVVGQSVAPGTSTLTGSTVTVDVSSGAPAPSPVTPLPPPPQ